MEAIPVLMTLSGRAYGGTVEEEEVVDLMTTGLLYPLKEGWKLTYTETPVSYTHLTLPTIA